MERKGTRYLDLYIDENNVGFDLSPDLMVYNDVVVMDGGAPTSSVLLCVNIQDKYLERIIEMMGSDNLYVQTFHVYLLKNEIGEIVYNGKRGGSLAQPKRMSDYYYAFDDLSGKGNALYVDSYGNEARPIQKSVKFEVRVFRRPDGANWTVVYTYPQ